jgi:hypothetical protein
MRSVVQVLRAPTGAVTGAVPSPAAASSDVPSGVASGDGFGSGHDDGHGYDEGYDAVADAPGSSAAPMPDLTDLPVVVERVRQAGLPVDARWPDAWPPCPSICGLAAVRVAQEALTNVLMHSDAASARVELWCDGGNLVLRVHDDGPARPRDPARRGGGNGLVHMRERAAACGGAVRVGPDPDGGWTVLLRLPLGGVAAG